MEWVGDVEQVAADYSLAWPQSYLQLAADGMLDSRSVLQPFPLLHFSTDFEVLDAPQIRQRLAMLADPDDFRRVDPVQKLLPFGMEPNGNLYCFHGAVAEGGSVPIILLQNDEQEDAHLAPDMAGFIFAHMIETAPSSTRRTTWVRAIPNKTPLFGWNHTSLTCPKTTLRYSESCLPDH